jgi:hypothetical protein
MLIRSEPVINLLFTIFSAIPTSAPLAIRRICANVYHIGGIHVECVIAALIWFGVFTVGASIELSYDADTRTISLAATILSYIITVLLLAISTLSIPVLRNKFHDAWESAHRFGGRTVLALYWVLVGISTPDLARTSSASAYARNPLLYLPAASTAVIIYPWLFLRRVAITSEYLSHRAIRLHFPGPIPPGRGVRLARRPLGDWHGFATMQDSLTDSSGREGFSVIVSRAGDFTSHLIDTAPTHIWRRGIPTCGVLRVATLFSRIVVVAIGSGIGPCLSIFPFSNIHVRVLWVARDHKASFGKELVEAVRRRDPRAVLCDTSIHGKPDLAKLALWLWRESGAEAVAVVSNKKGTRELVWELERRGSRVLGPLSDGLCYRFRSAHLSI